MKKAALLLSHNFEDLEAVAPFALLKRAGVQVDIFFVPNCETTPQKSPITHCNSNTQNNPLSNYNNQNCDSKATNATLSHYNDPSPLLAVGKFGLQISNVHCIDQFGSHDYDCIILPGGGGYVTLKESTTVKEIILEFASSSKLIAAICASPTILGSIGLLNGKNYTCFKSMNKDFGGTYKEQYVVTDGQIITACSAAASIDFALAIIASLCGKTVCDGIKSQIMYK